MRRTLIEAIDIDGMDGRAIEDILGEGTPDINYTLGWIECKRLKAWPKRAATPVRIAHPMRFRKQALWLRRRANAGGKAHLTLLVGREWLLLSAETAYKMAFEGMTQEQIVAAALARWEKRLIKAEFTQKLREAA